MIEKKELEKLTSTTVLRLAEISAMIEEVLGDLLPTIVASNPDLRASLSTYLSGAKLKTKDPIRLFGEAVARAAEAK